MKAKKPPVPSGNYALRFSDEFDGTALDRTKWQTAYPWGYHSQPGNGQEDTDANLSVSNSLLHITAKREDVTDPNYGIRHYTSGLISSWAGFDFTYGKVEVRAKCPAGRGFWTALWIVPVDMSWPPEIDILELLGVSPAIAHLNYHGTGKTSRGSTWTAPTPLSNDFHIYEAEWTPTECIWRIDGIERFRCAVVIPKPMYVICELKVGGTGDTWAMEPDATTPFPSSLDIDYVRVWQRS